MTPSKGLFAASSVLWVIWGAVHVFAGVMTLSQATGASVAGIADAVDPVLLTTPAYHDAVGAVINQHGWNLAWIGLGVIGASAGVFRGRRWGVGLAALLGGMTDLGYFLFMDLGGFVHFLPGTLMTLICLAAIVTSGAGSYLQPSSEVAA